MQYLELTFYLTPNDEAACDALAALLADAGCETFVPTDSGQTAYVQRELFEETCIKAALDSFHEFFPQVEVSYTCADVPDENWNATWEAEHHFEPITLPDGQQIQIIPRQAFGSGEHATTRMMLSLLAHSAPSGKTVIDAGCGTGVLGIAAMKLGARSVFAYDIDEWSVRNALDNFALNDLSANIELGDSTCLTAAPLSDILLANINRNILLADLPAFSRHIATGGHLLLSGFFEADIPALTEAASHYGLTLLDTQSDGEWRALKFLKS